MVSETEFRESLERVAELELEFGALLMECGATARHVEEIATQVAIGLGANVLSMGYASISITVARNSASITRMSSN